MARRGNRSSVGISAVNIGAEFTDEQDEFIKAILQYRQMTGRGVLTCSEYLGILKSLGYRRVAEPRELPSYVKPNATAE